MSDAPAATVAPSLEETRASLITRLQTATAEELRAVAAALPPPPDPLREGNGPDETVVGYAGEREVTLGELRARARGADAAIAEGRTYSGAQIREHFRQKHREA